MATSVSLSAATSGAASQSGLMIEQGDCYACFVYDIGLHVDLSRAESLLQSSVREHLQHRRRAPAYFTFQPAPIRVFRERPAGEMAGYRTSPAVEVLIYDFGAAQVTYRIPLAGPFEALLALSDALYDNAALLADSRLIAEEVSRSILPAISRPNIASLTEDYVIYQISAARPAIDLSEFLSRHGAAIAQILRSEQGPMSRQEIDDALAVRASFRPDDIAIIDWNASLLIDQEAEDVRAVLEFVNVELLEMRFLDHELDVALGRESAASVRMRPGRKGATRAALRRVAEMQIDAALLYEEVNNALKLLGDVYLARIYRLASQRLHLAEWDSSILRKLETLESVYQKLSDQQTDRRMEVLEWIIIILIAVSIVLPFIPGLPGH
jgi:hypothetical protein